MPSPKQEVGMQEVLKFARIEESTVEDTVEINNQLVIITRCEDFNIHKPNSPIETLTKCSSIDVFGNDGSRPGTTRVKPKKGTRCLVLFKNPQDFSRGFYLGAINEPYSRVDYPSVASSPGSFKYINDKGSGVDVSADGTVKLISFHGTVAALNASSFSFITPGETAFLGVSPLAIRLSNNSFSILSNSEKTDMMSVGAFRIVSTKGRTTIGGQSGRFDFEGGKLDTLASLIEEKSEGRVVSAGYYKYKGISAKAFSSDPTAPTYEVSILEGGTVFYNASGSFTIGILDPTTNKFLSYVGPTEEAPMSKIEQKMTSIETVVDVGGIGVTTSKVKLDTTAALMEYKAATANTKIELTASRAEIDFAPTGTTASNLKMQISGTRLEHDIAGSLMALLELKVTGDAKLLGKNEIKIFSNSQDITIASGSLVGESIASPTLQIKLDSMLQRIEAKILQQFGLTVMTSEVHGNPDVTAGLTPGSPFPVNVSLRQHGHLTLLGPTITKLPADLVPLV